MKSRLPEKRLPRSLLGLNESKSNIPSQSTHHVRLDVGEQKILNKIEMKDGLSCNLPVTHLSIIVSFFLYFPPMALSGIHSHQVLLSSKNLVSITLPPNKLPLLLPDQMGRSTIPRLLRLLGQKMIKPSGQVRECQRPWYVRKPRP